MGNPRARAMKGPRLSQTTTVASDKALFGGSFFLFLSRAQCGRVQWLAPPPGTESAVFWTLSGEWMRSIVQEREAKESERTSNQQSLIFKQAAVIVSFRWFRFVPRSPLLEPPPPPPLNNNKKLPDAASTPSSAPRTSTRTPASSSRPAPTPGSSTSSRRRRTPSTS